MQPESKGRELSETPAYVTGKGLKYSNPRKLPSRWIEKYLERDPDLLALDVMRAFDQNYDQQSQLDSAKHWIKLLMLFVGLQSTVIGILVKLLLPLIAHAR